MERILIVDMDEGSRIALRDAALEAGYAVAGTADSGVGALALAREVRPDFVLMDIRLELGTGCGDSAEAIGAKLDLPVILLTTADGQESVETDAEGLPRGYLRKPATARRLRAALELERCKLHMAAELRKARQAAKAAERAKTSFLATISHELRTPMNGVLGMTELLLLSDLEEPYRENVGLIRESAMSLLTVLNQIIDYSRLEASSLQLRDADFRLEDLVAGVLSQHQRTAAAKGLKLGYTLDPAIPGWLRGDSGKVRQVLGNLLGNAVKFTAAGQVMVDISLDKDGNGAGTSDVLPLRMLVQDTGIGIPSDKLEAIFDSFVQGADHLTHTTGSLGLGLAIVNRLVAMLGGSVRCSSQEGRGSIFSVELPLGRSRYAARSPLEMAMGEEKPLAGARVLVAEDEPVNQRYITRLLEKMGCAVTLTEDGEGAVEALRAVPFDIVLMDVEMPVMTGIEATLAIRRPETGCLDPEVPIVALTAHAMWGDEQRCLHAGMTGYVPKPVDIETVAAIIQSTLGERTRSAA
ncbi:MAG: response regulator [Pseudodesulfovibrio sp.]